MFLLGLWRLFLNLGQENKFVLGVYGRKARSRNHIGHVFREIRREIVFVEEGEAKVGHH